MMRRRKRVVEDGLVIDAGVERPVETVAAPTAAAASAAAPAAVAVPARPAPVRAPVTEPVSGDRLEAMVAAPPSADNPFRTYKKRLARARFLLAREEAQSAATHVPAQPATPPQTIHAEPQMQTVYRLGSGRGANMGYKPQTR